MVSNYLLLVGFFYLFSHGFLAIGGTRVPILSNQDSLTAMELPVDSGCSFDDCFDDIGEHEEFEVKSTMALNIRHRKETWPTDMVLESTAGDLNRIQTLHTRIVDRKKQKPISRIKQDDPHQSQSSVFALAPSPESSFSGQLMATLKSGVSLGSGEYQMDVFVGTPPKYFSLILDTGSDLNWIQCDPCYDCFEQKGPYYNPLKSSSFRNISCHDPRCNLVSSPAPLTSRKNEDQSCPCFYWYGDFALETFMVNLMNASGRKSRFRKVENVMFGCGHWNKGLFHGAAGVLGLGRVPLSFSSQLQPLYGDSFSYCLVDRNSNTASKLVFGEDRDLINHPGLNFTKLVEGKENLVNTFYYVQIKSVVVDGEELHIPEETWNMSTDGSGGVIIDSGTTLSYFADPAYKIIKEAFLKKVRGYEVVKDFPIMDPCYKASKVDKLELPSFGFIFGDGAIWNFPVENYFIKLEPENMICLALMGTPRSVLSIIGNYQQQNFHILYDTKRSRPGFVQRKCDDI
ncbi:Aspartyl protease [Handroanthus impetiginosus]|uniref:Aspartyl protease n=1 Tax=Handroanthus impetiginosus TaxID=429701 RepID=A0A2G9HS61_9LAMI|nr:Aspartyl protease [Handroanthus impetiginosus]